MDCKPIVAYIAGPYRDPRGPYFIGENIRQAREVAVELWKLGVPTLCPHTNTSFLDGIAPDEVFLRGDLLMLSRCDVLVLTPRWAESAGARAEKLEAERLGLPVFVWPAQQADLQQWLASLPAE